MANFDISGWATRANVKCSDGRVILKDAFKHNDGQTVPLVWNHQHNTPENVLGHALLENREEGVYAYCSFNDTESGQAAKLIVKHGDVNAFSIFANNLIQQKTSNAKIVSHGDIREVSLVLAGANPEARIENVLVHGENSDTEVLFMEMGEEYTLTHADAEPKEEKKEEEKVVEKEAEEAKNDKTLKEVYDEMTEEQKTVVHAFVGLALEDKEEEKADEEENEEVKHSESEGGNETMKTNVFDQKEMKQENVLTHADQEAIIALAKQSNVGSFKHAMELFAEENELAHGIFENYGELFPEFELLKKGEPETLFKYDQGWVATALRKIHKSPLSRIRTRQADARIAELKAKGYQNKGDQKTVMNKIKLIGRTTDPQTIYIKDDMHRDDVIDITDFSVVDYQWKMMRTVLDETLVLAALVGDGREEGDPDKIHETHIRSIWNDEEDYTIHADVDIEAAKVELQGSETGAHFGENYIYAEAIITAALYAREKFKGSGSPDFYCTPHLVNVMLLARDLNGRRIYDSKADLAKALNVASIVEVEQFEGLTRTTKGGETKKLLGLFVNLNDYQFGATKGGEITRFEDFDMDFNKQKFMLEARLSGSLTKLQAAIALEEPIEDAEG